MSVEGFNYDNIFIRMLNRIGDAFLLSVLFVVFSLPVFTIGASITALYYTAMKGITQDDGYVWKYFIKSFKENFKQSTIIWIISVVVLFVLGVDVWFWFKGRTPGSFSINNVMIVVSVVMLSLAVMTEIFIYPLQAKFDNTIQIQIRNAFLLSIKYFPTTIIVALSMAVIAWAFYYQPGIAFVGFAVVGFGAVGYFFGYMMYKCLKPYLPEATPLGEECFVLADEPDGDSTEASCDSEEAADTIEAETEDEVEAGAENEEEAE